MSYSPSAGSGGDDAESYSKFQLEIANKDRAQLEERLQQLENQVSLLKRAVFELSMAPQRHYQAGDFSIDVRRVLRDMAADVNNATASGVGSAIRRVGPGERAAGSVNSLGGGRREECQYAVCNPFVSKATLTGHTAAVYAVQFSPNGQLLASTSFDRSISIWAMDKYVEKSNNEALVNFQDAHRSQVVAVEWTFDSTHVVTAGFDQYASEWDIPAASNVSRFPCYGLVHSVCVSPANDALFFASTSEKAVHLFDRRVAPRSQRSADDCTIIVNNDRVVNSVYVQLDGQRFVTGDSGGAIKTWDLRKISEVGGISLIDKDRRDAALFHTTYNGVTRKPITHVHASPPAAGENHGRFMAVNCYDNCLRVYDRGSFIFESKKVELKLVHALQGFVNENCPIKSSFFLGADYRPSRARRSRPSDQSRRNTNRASQIPDDVSPVTDGVEVGESSDERDSLSYGSSTDDEVNGENATQNESSSRWNAHGHIQDTMTLATGSADGCVYIFDVGGGQSEGALMQRLDEHRDRVYAVDFHPVEPILASCSADSDIKIWVATSGHMSGAHYG